MLFSKKVLSDALIVAPIVGAIIGAVWTSSFLAKPSI